MQRFEGSLKGRILKRAHICEMAESGHQCKMHVRLDKAGYNDTPCQINRFGCRSSRCQDVLPTADSQNSISGYRQRRMFRESGVHREHFAVQE